MIAAESVAKSTPDGYTILISTPANNYVTPELRKDMQFDPRHDLAPVTLASTTPIVLVANPSVKAATLDDMLDLARRAPGSISYATTAALGPQTTLPARGSQSRQGSRLMPFLIKAQGPQPLMC